MNKWTTLGFTGLIIVASASTASATPAGEVLIQQPCLTEATTDAHDVAGGSKLKDRGFIFTDDDIELVKSLQS